MTNEQHQLMWHLFYTESLLEKVADAIAVEDRCECPICKSKFRVYLPFGNGFWSNAVGIGLRPNARCPKCGSLERHRALYYLLQHMDWHREGMRVLHFAPEPIFNKLFSSFKDIDYWPVDLNPNMRGVKKAVDITNITFDDDSFDLIMCTHVLEHIPDEKKALSELHRVLKPKTGIAFLNVPMFNMPKTLEKPEYNTPELRLKYYGQEDHVRAYGLDYPQHLREAGFDVQIFKMQGLDEKLLKRYGLDRNEKIFWCRKE